VGTKFGLGAGSIGTTTLSGIRYLDHLCLLMCYSWKVIRVVKVKNPCNGNQISGFINQILSEKTFNMDKAKIMARTIQFLWVYKPNDYISLSSLSFVSISG
jgi:hypothetical protein